MKVQRNAETSVPSGPDGQAVRQMFAEIAHRYDFLNHFLSASIDRRWRRVASRQLQKLIGPSSGACLDLCSGTGDLALEVHRRLGVPVISSDFCHPMLARASGKIRAAGLDNVIRTVEADALALPFREAAFEGLTVAFGLRNLQDRRQGLLEMLRVLKPGGAIVILEFSRPVIPVFREAFQFYFRNFLPRLGAWISGQGTAYRYLPDSVGKFLTQGELAALLRAIGFTDVDYRNLSGGIAALHWGRKA